MAGSCSRNLAGGVPDCALWLTRTGSVSHLRVTFTRRGARALAHGSHESDDMDADLAGVLRKQVATAPSRLDSLRQIATR